jgi:predicted N-formylglutamate amidohydrolase
MHSFTPRMHGRERPWEIGVLWDRDRRLPVPAIEWLRARGWTVGDNEPYSGRGHHGYTQHVHGDRLGLANILLELRQDLIATEDGQARWADELTAMFHELLADETVYRIRMG